jgi:hypothetical protein
LPSQTYARTDEVPISFALSQDRPDLRFLLRG